MWFISSPFSERAKQSLIECVGIPFEIASLTAFVRNDDKAGIVRHLPFLSRCSRMCLNYHLSTFAEAIAKPVAARPERATANEIVNDILCRFKNLFE